MVYYDDRRRGDDSDAMRHQRVSSMPRGGARRVGSEDRLRSNLAGVLRFHNRHIQEFGAKYADGAPRLDKRCSLCSKGLASIVETVEVDLGPVQLDQSDRNDETGSAARARRRRFREEERLRDSDEEFTENLEKGYR